MPLALLHRDLYRGYSARREGHLALHARKMAIAYAEELGREKPYFGFSEGLMVNFASDLAQTGASGAARGLLEQALRLNRGYRPAMLSLGFSFEQNSEYLEAASTYQRLVDTHPGFDEGRLRLAINLIRTGRDEAGEELLRGLLGTGARTWVEAVAAQELVRLKAERLKLLPEAEREVRAALELIPTDQRLWILLAAILEQPGSPRRSHRGAQWSSAGGPRRLTARALCRVAGSGRQGLAVPPEWSCFGGAARPQSGPVRRGDEVRTYFLVLVLSLVALAPAGAQEIWVTIVEPKDGDLVIGELDIVVDVVSRAEIAEIEFQLDGRPIGTLLMEPFRMPVDLGEDNVTAPVFGGG